MNYPVQHLHSLEKINLKDAWLTVGVFDGVHRGHQEILQRLVSGAHATGSPAVVLTFDPHPAVVFGGKTEFKCLTPPDERAKLLGLFGVDVVITQTFDRAYADQTAEEFMRHVARTLGLRSLIIGYDTALGRARQGNAARLTEIGQQLGYTVEVVPPLKDEAGIISSTRIRGEIATGDVSAAASALGRYYPVNGPVVHGDGRGRLMDFPTANIQVPPGKALPANGIYACWVWVNGNKIPAATSIGVRPTFMSDDLEIHIEAHLLDFHEELYGQQIKLEFVEYLRPEEKFPSAEALITQIQADILQTRKILRL